MKCRHCQAPLEWDTLGRARNADTYGGRHQCELLNGQPIDGMFDVCNERWFKEHTVYDAPEPGPVTDGLAIHSPTSPPAVQPAPAPAAPGSNPERPSEPLRKRTLRRIDR